MSGPATADKAELKAPRGLSPLLAQSFPIAAAVVLVCGTALLALLTSGSNAPVMLTLLGLFAALGVFLMFGLIAGHIRIGERTTEIDLLQGVFEQIDQGTLITRGDGLIAYGNPASADLLGVKSASDLRLLEDAFSPDEDANAALFRLSRSVERNRARSEDIFVPARAGLGTGRWLRVSAKPFARAHVDTNLRGAALWTLTDITRDKSFEAQTRSNLERELDTFRGMPAGFFVAEASGRLTYANDQLCRWLGITWDEGDRELMLSDIASGDSASLIASIIERAGTDTQRVELDLVTDGGLAWPATLVLQTNEGATEHTASSVSAIVLPQVATHAAQITGAGHSTDALGGFFKSAPFGIATITAEGEIGGANTAFARLMVSSETAEGSDARRTFSRATTADGAADIHAALDEALAGRANIAPIEITVGDAGQFTRRLFFATTGRDDAEGRSAVVYVIDATEQKALEQKFAQSQKMEVVGKLAGGIAHDFNNVMTAIIGFSDLLLGTHRPGDPAFQHIRSIRTSAERAADLVRNLLAFSRQQQLSPKVLQVDDVIGDVLQMLRQTTLRDSIDLKINTARDLWLVEADKNELERVVVNLSVNARDAMPDGGRLTVRTRNVSERESQRMSKDGMTVGEYVLIEFEDTGTGIPADVLAKVFDPFFTTKDVGKGTGLGLSTVYGIVKQTGGYIFADSVEGKGTTFRVYLPRHEPPAEADGPALAEEKADEPATPHRDLTGVGRVLIVEDEDAVRMFATQALKRQGYDVHEACDGYEALDLFDDEDFAVDLVVSDVKMPEMDGPTLLKELRKTKPDLRFVFVSGYPADAFSKTLADEDNYTFLPKPYSLAQIAATVKEQLAV